MANSFFDRLSARREASRAKSSTVPKITYILSGYSRDDYLLKYNDKTVGLAVRVGQASKFVVKDSIFGFTTSNPTSMADCCRQLGEALARDPQALAEALASSPEVSAQARGRNREQEVPDGSMQRRGLVCSCLWQSFERQDPGVAIDTAGYVPDFRDNLLPLVCSEDFEEDLRHGAGNELENKFRAVHSSAALAVNCFAPFRRRIADLALPGIAAGFDSLQFERECPSGLRGKPPTLDVLLSGPAGVVAIESKLTEFLSDSKAEFSESYRDRICDGRREQGYFREMLDLMDDPETYVRLDAAQLIKHAFGLEHSFPDLPVTLLYLFWEPTNSGRAPEFAEHREEIAEFAERVEGSRVAFAAMSYPELWAKWREGAPEWLSGHLDNLEQRYLVEI